ncbi:MAG: GNAT family N-acetyltransferase [Planctomycetota bacterium]|jgi:GNAT superfamily N-acetyltransferase
MNEAQEYIEIEMIRDNLDNINSYSLPDGFSIQWYRKGYEQFWLDIHYKTEKYEKINRERYKYEFGTNVKLLSRRQCFLFDSDNNAVGTATAWFDKSYHGQRFGKFHWLAIAPEMQGRGLAKALVSCICNKMWCLGHKRAYLVTATPRIPAINLYLKFGFLPRIDSEKDLDIWRKLQKKLKEPIDLRKHL